MAQKQVLVIEDSTETQQLLAELVLEPNDYRSLAALDGEEGLRLAIEERPDLIILDMKLPKMDGLEVLQALRERNINIPVIFTTVAESAELVVQAFRLGARDYVMKPFAPDEMLEAIERAITTTRSLEKRDQLTQQLLEANQKLQRQLQELNVIYTIGRSVTSVLDVNRVLNRVVEAAVYVAGAEEGLLLLLNEEEDELYLRAAKNVDEKLARSMRVRVDDSVAGRAIQTDRPVLVSGERSQIITGYLAQAMLYLPLRVPERGVIGVLGVINRESERNFSERDIFLLSALADYAAIAIENAHLFETAVIEQVKLEAVLREAGEPIIVVDEKNRVLLCNAAARAALDLEEATVRERPVAEVIPNQMLCDMFAQAQEEKRAIHSEASLEDGRTFNAMLTPIEGVGRVLIMQDITHLKELDRIKSEFVAAVSHDLRTPLGLIKMSCTTLMRDDVQFDHETQTACLEDIETQVDTLTEIVDNMLDLARIESGGLKLNKHPLDVTTLAREVVNALQTRLTHHTITLDFPNAPLIADGDQHHISAVFRNLLDNAIKYARKGTAITISGRVEDNHVLVQVNDHGFGIPAESVEKVFERFYRVESKATRHIRGVGLGLAVCRGIIKAHKGKIWVESVPGEGSTFSFTLPASNEQPPLTNKS